jgi:tRNA G10  N-methylase Trm11
MKKLITLSGILALGIILGGCPYETKVPVDNPTLKINPKLIGTWEEQKDHDIYKVIRQDEFTYAIDVTENKKNEVDHNIAYMSEVNGATFLNVWDNKPSGSEKKYSLYKIEMRGDDLVKVFPLTENIREQFTSGE